MPSLWKLSPDEQCAAVQLWLTENWTPRIVLFDGLTGEGPIHPNAINLLRQQGSWFAYWAIEDPMWSHEVVSSNAKKGPYAVVADCVFSPAIECVRRYRRYGIRSELLPFGMNPDFHRPVPVVGRPRDVVLVANYYGHRAAQLEHLLLQPALSVTNDVAIYGHGWEQCNQSLRQFVHGPLDYAKLPSAYASAKVALGAEQCLNDSETQCSMRIFEVLGCAGAAYLGPDHRAHRKQFDVGTEIELVVSPEDCARKVERLLTQESRRCAMVRAGRQAVVSRHAYETHARQIAQVYQTGIDTSNRISE